MNMQMLKEVVHQTEPDFQYIKDEHGQIVKTPTRRHGDLKEKIITTNMKGATAQK